MAELMTMTTMVDTMIIFVIDGAGYTKYIFRQNCPKASEVLYYVLK